MSTDTQTSVEAIVSEFAQLVQQNYALCPFTAILLDVLDLFPIIIAAVFSSLRVYALLDRNVYVPGLVLTLGLLAPVAISITRDLRDSPVCLDESSCVVHQTLEGLYLQVVKVYLAINVLLVTSDLIVVIVTWTTTFRSTREGFNVGLAMETTTSLLVNGTFYFLALLAISVIQIPYSVMPSALVTFINIFSNYIQTILISRFIVNLRHAAEVRGGSDLSSPSTYSFLHFKTVSVSMGGIIGNLGEPLRMHEDQNDWDTDDDSGEHIQSHVDDDSPPGPAHHSGSHIPNRESGIEVYNDCMISRSDMSMKNYQGQRVSIIAGRPSKFRRLTNIAGLIILASLVSGLINVFQAYHNQIPERILRQSHSLDATSQWKDETWPFRNQTPWDISTDFPFPRTAEYDVNEGTWMRLDVHPKTGDVVFDIMGDIYCLPGNVYLKGIDKAESQAYPVLLGIPHDSDARFSPDGSRLAFRSDAELGIDNIWTMEWKGCEAMDVRPKSAKGHLSDALQTKQYDDDLLIHGVKETRERRFRRLYREGRAGGKHTAPSITGLHNNHNYFALARRVTNETFRWVTDPRFHPSGDKIIATKWYTSRSTAGAGEGWVYDIPKDESRERIIPGAGQRVVGRSLPLGWEPADYGDITVGPEQFVWNGNDSIVYSKNVIDVDGHWTYSKDIHTGIYAIFCKNLTNGKTRTLVSSSPGGASRPELSRDGRSLAFVRRVRDNEALVIKDLVTGTIHHIWNGLTYDLTTVYAPMGTYPSFSFTPNDDAIIIWAAGKIWHVPLTINASGEKLSAIPPTPIHFTVHIEKRIANTLRVETDVLRLGMAHTQRISALVELRTNEDGSKFTFQASGATYLYSVESSTLKTVPVLQQDASYFSPSFAPGADDLVIHARWSDINFTTFELANTTCGTAYELTGVPLGRYYSPVLGKLTTRGRKVAFIKTGGDAHTGNVVATAKAGLYVGEISLPTPSRSNVVVKNMRFISAIPGIETPARTKVTFIEDDTKVLVQHQRRAMTIDIVAGPNSMGENRINTLALGRTTTELAVTMQRGATNVAIVDYHHVYFAPNISFQAPIFTKPGNATQNLTRLSLDGGHDITWSADGEKLCWFSGPLLYSLRVSDLGQCASEIAKDTLNFGISCTKKLVDIHEIQIEHPTDAYRLKQDALRLSGLNGTDEENADTLVIVNATVLTMETGDLSSDVLRNATLLTKGSQIEAVSSSGEITIPLGATVIDAEGGYVTPGFIDVHAHWGIFTAFYPAQPWEFLAFMAYGVTTVHNPSGDNVRGYWERSRVESGQIIGPRIFQTGDAVFAGTWEGLHEEITTMEEAYSALARIKAEGGPASFSYKNYDLPSRASRQRLLLIARKLGMICLPEGGMNYDWDQAYIVDGMTTIEHSLPIPVLYNDIKTLFALSGTGYTPTHVVNYGGVWGEQYVWATEDIPNDEKLRRFIPHDILERLSESTTRPKNSYALWNTSESTAKMVRMGLKAHIGAHGEQPMGLNYHAEMFFARQGGLSNYEVLRAATSDAAKTLGIFSGLGSLTSGKLADFLIFPADFDVLTDDIKKTRDIRYVAKGGRVWDAATMVEVWPNKGRRPVVPPLNPD
ncbi:hypothetical protein NM688_g2275 [Phlebia brevispora]|uniref:Uncharacterized protein n=1 Tax=Phlebia brevispora TaxID=194682 RepID=A0ACC1T996_9APHY|nr:hypothetical protein NM688_g2275 [Phlebia brevispora]